LCDKKIFEMKNERWMGMIESCGFVFNNGGVAWQKQEIGKFLLGPIIGGESYVAASSHLFPAQGQLA